MIAASEPLEFVPHGRIVLASHPGQIYGKSQNVSASENSLLYKLTNFGIKDESLLDSKDEDGSEWWCIREVYYTDSQVADDDDSQQSTKDGKDECMSESFRPQSRLKNEFNISIKSELAGGVKRMETECLNSAGTSRGGSANSSSNMSKKFNLNSGQDKSPKKKRLNPKTDCSYEEELYVKGCTAVWSKGLSTPASKQSNTEHRETISCYTLESPIKHAAFCNFHISINNMMLIDTLNSQIGDVKKNIKIEDDTEHIPKQLMPSILLMDNKCMRVYAVDGREYLNSIPFQVKKIWPMKYGVLLEKEAAPAMHNSFLPSFLKLNDTHNSSYSKTKSSIPFNMSAKLRSESVSGYEQDVTLPTCFSLSHPLDEVMPILVKSPAHGLQYYNDGDLQIIFVSSDPSIVLLYDTKLATHSLWKIRRAVREECLAMCPNTNSTTTVFSQTGDFVHSPMHSNIKNATTSLGSPFHSRRGLHTPTFCRSRQNSPMANLFHQQGLSPHGSVGQASLASMLASSAQAPPALPLYPEICLDHIWTDGQTVRRDPIENPADTKTFLHTDLVGHDYLCFMLKVRGASRLQIVRLQKSHSQGQPAKCNLIVGAASSVAAKDAVVLEHLKMIALIDEAGNIILQSGNSVVGKVHVGGVLASLIDSPYGVRGGAGGAGGAGGGGGGGGAAAGTPFPRRSSLLPSRSGAGAAAALDDPALHLLSPVPHAGRRPPPGDALGSSGVCGVRDAAGARVTLSLAAGGLYRVELPALAGARRVAACCVALAAVLPRDVAMQVLIKWYGVRNAPGTQDLTPEQEWTMFADLLYSLIGYDVESLTETKQEDQPDHPEVATKKQRTSCDGTQDDWEYLLNTKMHKTIGSSLAGMLNLNIPNPDTNKNRHVKMKNGTDKQKPTVFNCNSLLFPYTPQVLYTLHLLYEEFKLNVLLFNDLKPLSTFLYQLAKDLKLSAYVNHYWLDFPADLNLEYEGEHTQMSDETLQKLSPPGYFSNEPPHIFSYLDSMMRDIDVGYYPYLSDVNPMSKTIIEVLCVVGCGRGAGAQAVAARGGAAASSTPRGPARAEPPPAAPHCRALELLAERGVTARTLAALPAALWLALLALCARCRAAPPERWPPALYRLALRDDLALQAEIAARISTTTEYMESLALEVLEKETAYSRVGGAEEPPAAQAQPDDGDAPSGMEHLNTKLLALLYPRDHRINEVISLLQSSAPVTVNLTQRADVSDHDFIEEQEKQLLAYGVRTAALPVARGMVTLRSLPCSGTEPAAAPRLCVAGRGPAPRRAAIAPPADLGPQALLWPAFHNGAAAGLALVPMTGSTIHSTWVVYNKPRGLAELSTEHAGFLMALGLNGHLKDMPFMSMYEYFVKCHEMISIGLLLGLAASYKGTMDVQATKLMSIHLEPLLPPTSVELDVPRSVLVAALMGVGLLYQGTGHAHYAQVLLNEIGRPVGGDAESCSEREGYALAAGLALGLVCAGAGPAAPAAAPQRLRAYMRGGGGGGAGRAAREAAAPNLDVTSPGATLALGLLFQRTGDAALAGWLRPPATAYELDYVRPDLLMLRVIARGLILWDSIEPTDEWVEAQVPDTIQPNCFVKPVEDNVDYEAMNQAYCNIVGGACFALGLRYAGSGCEAAKRVALGAARRLLELAGSPYAELPGRSTLEGCLCVCLLAAGMIMSGRGDLEVLRLCRRLRARVAHAQPHHALTHGGQMAVHCTIGLLFLGGGRATLSSSPTAVAALVAAFFPKFPTHSEDNRYHLQAFRHLYVLAVEPRLLLPRDIDSGKLCYAHIQVVETSGATRELRAPCLLPELRALREVRVRDPRYWPITFRRGANWDQLQTFLECTWCVDIKQRAGCLSYADDPLGHRTILARTLTLERGRVWAAAPAAPAAPAALAAFAADDRVRCFTAQFLADADAPGEDGATVCGDCLPAGGRRLPAGGSGGGGAAVRAPCQCRGYGAAQREHLQGLSIVAYECVVRDALCALPVWTTFLRIVKSIKEAPTSHHAWQMRLLQAHIEHRSREALAGGAAAAGGGGGDGGGGGEPLISGEYTLAMQQQVSQALDEWEARVAPYLRRYAGLPSGRRLARLERGAAGALGALAAHRGLRAGCLRGLAGAAELRLALAPPGPGAAALAGAHALLR